MAASSTLVSLCVGAMHFVLSGHISASYQLTAGIPLAFPQEVPNNGFILTPKPETWQLEVKFRDPTSNLNAGGLIWTVINGPPMWKRGQVVSVTVNIADCPDYATRSAVERWGGFEFLTR